MKQPAQRVEGFQLPERVSGIKIVFLCQAKMCVAHSSAFIPKPVACFRGFTLVFQVRFLSMPGDRWVSGICDQRRFDLEPRGICHQTDDQTKRNRDRAETCFCCFASDNASRSPLIDQGRMHGKERLLMFEISRRPPLGWSKAVLPLLEPSSGCRNLGCGSDDVVAAKTSDVTLTLRHLSFAES
jgi:hypothetical protein